MSEFTRAVAEVSGLDHEPDELTALGLLANLMGWWGPSDRRICALAESMTEGEARRFQEAFPHLSGQFEAALWKPVQKRRRGGE